MKNRERPEKKQMFLYAIELSVNLSRLGKDNVKSNKYCS